MLERIAYIFLGIFALLYLGSFLFAAIMAPLAGWFMAPLIIGVGLLLLKVILDRLNNDEDDYYSKNVDQ